MVKPGHAKSVDFANVSSAEKDKNNESSEFFIASTQNYDILMNGAYQYKFLYVPSWLLDRLSFIATPKY